jgi:Zn-dependent M28 family amino/carboxypeptidase
MLAACSKRTPGPEFIVTESLVRSHMEFLASDALNGRGSGTRDEWIAATYIASQFERMGLEPLGDHGGYLQTVEVAKTGGKTWNVLAALRGTGTRANNEAILLSAHLDHLGLAPANAGTAAVDRIFNGADDDASGTTAVLALAEALARGPRPKRTILFALFGSEEVGGHGARRVVEQPPIPLQNIIANLEFEMIGRPDPKGPKKTLWLTGWERSDLGRELARHGARLVADPRPEHNFFMRSDNIQLARRGVVAQTISSFGLHAEYHAPNDDLPHIDFAHMTEAIQSLVTPLRWLANSTFRPAWTPNGRPPQDTDSGRSR